MCTKLHMWPDLQKIMCIVHTSNFLNLVTHKILYELQMKVKLAGIVELLLLYHSWRCEICVPFPVVVMDLQMSKIECVNYARFPKSGHIYSTVQPHSCMFIHMPHIYRCTVLLIHECRSVARYTLGHNIIKRNIT